MKALSTYVSFFVIVAVLVGCQSSGPYPVSNGIGIAYPTISFSGAYVKDVKLDDVRQIVALAQSRRDILKPIVNITLDTSDEAEINSGDPHKTPGLMTNFRVRKTNGRWMIIEKSVRTAKVIITG